MNYGPVGLDSYAAAVPQTKSEIWKKNSNF